MRTYAPDFILRRGIQRCHSNTFVDEAFDPMVDFCVGPSQCACTVKKVNMCLIRARHQAKNSTAQFAPSRMGKGGRTFSSAKWVKDICCLRDYIDTVLDSLDTKPFCVECCDGVSTFSKFTHAELRCYP